LLGGFAVLYIDVRMTTSEDEETYLKTMVELEDEFCTFGLWEHGEHIE
jgi:hypothetical protein